MLLLEKQTPSKNQTGKNNFLTRIGLPTHLSAENSWSNTYEKITMIFY